MSLEEWIRSDILTNQVGYFVGMKKTATLLSSESSAVDFKVLDESGNEVFSGKSDPHGFDEDSGDEVHIPDFTDLDSEGTYTIQAGDAKSRAFKNGKGELYSYCSMML